MATGSGKMSDSINRTNKFWKWGTLGVTVFFAALLFLIPGYPNDYVKRAGAWWGLLGVVLLIIAALMAWFADRYAEHYSYFIIWLVLLALGICAACGFDFSMFGIAERP